MENEFLCEKCKDTGKIVVKTEGYEDGYKIVFCICVDVLTDQKEGDS